MNPDSDTAQGPVDNILSGRTDRTAPAELRRVHLCYAPPDESYSEELTKHLLTLKNGRARIRVTTHQDITPGDDQVDSRKRLIYDADAILLLNSADFLSQKDCRIDQSLAIARASVIPVVLVLCRPCLWDALSSDGRITVLPTSRRAVSTHSDKDSVYARIVGAVRSLLESGTVLNSSTELPAATGTPGGDFVAPPDTDWRARFLVVFGVLLGLLLGIIIARPYVYHLSQSLGSHLNGSTLVGIFATILSPVALFALPVLHTLRTLREFDFRAASRRRPVITAPFAPLAQKCHFCGNSANEESRIALEESAMFTMKGKLTMRVRFKTLPRCAWCSAFHGLIERTGAIFRGTSWTIFVASSILILMLFNFDAGVIVMCTPLLVILCWLLSRAIGSVAMNVLRKRFTPPQDHLHSEIGGALATVPWTETEFSASLTE